MSALIERVDRWASSLPLEDSIPVSESEVYEFAFWLNENANPPSAMRLRMLLDQLQRSQFVYHGHRVVVI